MERKLFGAMNTPVVKKSSLKGVKIEIITLMAMSHSRRFESFGCILMKEKRLATFLANLKASLKPLKINLILAR
jgi:hypothetical protein